MSLASSYCKQIKEQLRVHANFPLGSKRELGDYGVIQDHVFRRLGNIRQLGISFETQQSGAESAYQFESRGGVDVNLIAKGDLQPGGIPAVKAGLGIRFSRENAVFFAAAGCTSRSIDDVKSLQPQLIALRNQNLWESDYYVVIEVVHARNTTAVVSAGSDSEILLEAKSAEVPAIELGDASLDLGVKRSRNMALKVVTDGEQFPLMQLARLRGIFRDELRTESVAGEVDMAGPILAPDEDTAFWSAASATASIRHAAGDEEWESSEYESTILESLSTASAPNGFEVERTRTGYIPLLKACYDFAQGEPALVLPAGYTELARILTTAEETLEALEPPPVQRALDNDFAALSMPVLEGLGSNNVPRPDAFGFVVREDRTGEVIVAIRGTLTPDEWAKNFTAVPNPFNEVPGFGLVHLGFEKMWRRIRLSVQQGLQEVSPRTRLTVLGHSLGGAMAILGAVDLASNSGFTNVDVCTIGGPRVGKIRFRMNFNRLIPRCFRLTNQGDVVPHVPSVVTAWNHVGLEIPVKGIGGSNSHSLDAYLNGLSGMGTGLEIPSGAESVLESLEAPFIQGYRTR
ncbi:MAG: lipase family protein [Bryobacterales bacterium]|nr:lipase family protein [Bryobacterales bacterium]